MFCTIGKNSYLKMSHKLLPERQIKSQGINEQRIAELEALLAKRESLITDLVEESIDFKKDIKVMDSSRNLRNLILWT
jgi:hypothetical protein